jgi:hypothetical protein
MGGEGSGRKKEIEIPEGETPELKLEELPKKKPTKTKYRVKIKEQWRDFDEQTKAREWAREILSAPIYFVSLTKEEVEI